MITTLIFDLDGTLIDNRDAKTIAYVKAFGDVGIEIAPSHYHDLFGLRFSELAHKLAPGLDEAQLDQVKRNKSRYYRENVSLIVPNQPLIDFLAAHHSHYKTALATTASRTNAQFVLDHFGLTQYFDVFVFGEDVSASKPDPECYKICIKHCEVEPSQCLVFEDSVVGIKAAEAAGAGVIKVFGAKK